MKYEIVELEQKVVVGKSIITSSNDQKMVEQIGSLWQMLYNKDNGYYNKINNKATASVIGLYSDYTNDTYMVTVGAEVTKADSDNNDFITKTIVKGKYAKFAIHGNMIAAVANAWGEIWSTKLDRTFSGDFEEYLPCNCEHLETCNIETCCECDINIYVAIK